MNRILSRLVAAAALVAGGLAITPGAAHAASTAVITIESQWSSGYTAAVTVRNPGTTPINGWRVEFDLPAGTTVSNAWNVALARSGAHYTLTPASWNAVIAPGGSATAGFVAAGTGKPAGCLLDGAPCDGSGPDITPPTAPAHLSVAPGPPGKITIVWDLSTDDRGVVGYQVFLNQYQVGLVTGNVFQQVTPPPTRFTYRVRAVDAAGNLSPFAVLPLGFPADTVAPSVPANLRISSTGLSGILSAVWDPSTDDVALAGYEVTVNGVVTRTSDTKALWRFTIPGTYQVRVRAYDGAGNYSAPAVTFIAIDPLPPLPAS
jgi:chitinase